MSRNYFIFKPRSVLLLIFFIIGLIICATALGSGSGYVTGTWNIIGELVATPSDDPYAPKPGAITTDTWKIADSKEGLALTSSKGTISGQYTGNGAVFDGNYPLGSGMYMVVHIECFMSDSSSMYGTINNDYWYINAVTNVPIKTGLEAWKFRAKRQ
jgi:hypothetical protein